MLEYIYPYIYLYLLVSISLLLSRFTKINLFFNLSLILLSLFSGLRWMVGADYLAYINIFNGIVDDRPIESIEVLNEVVVKVIDKIGLPQEYTLFLYSCVTIYCFGTFLNFYSKNKELSLFIFMTLPPFYLSSMNQARQWLAVSLVMLSLNYLDIRNFKKFSLFFLISCGIHKSSLFFSPLYFFVLKPINITKILVFSLACLLITPFVDYIWSISPYSDYKNLEFFNEKFNYSFLYVNAFLPVLLIIFYYFKFGFNDFTNKNALVFNLSIYSFLILVIGILANIPTSYLVRVNSFFQSYLLLILPLLLTNYFGLKKLLFNFSIIIITSIYFFYTLIFNGDYYYIIPYTTFINN